MLRNSLARGVPALSAMSSDLSIASILSLPSNREIRVFYYLVPMRTILVISRNVNMFVIRSRGVLLTIP